MFSVSHRLYIYLEIGVYITTQMLIRMFFVELDNVISITLHLSNVWPQHTAFTFRVI